MAVLRVYKIETQSPTPMWRLQYMIRLLAHALKQRSIGYKPVSSGLPNCLFELCHQLVAGGLDSVLELIELVARACRTGTLLK